MKTTKLDCRDLTFIQWGYLRHAVKLSCGYDNLFSYFLILIKKYWFSGKIWPYDHSRITRNFGQDRQNGRRSIQNIPTLKLLSIQTIIYLLIRNYRQRSMQTNRLQLTSCLVSSQLIQELDKKDVGSIHSVLTSESSDNLNQYVVGHSADTSNQDSSPSKYSKCTHISQEFVFDENQSQELTSSSTHKSQKKELKKEILKNQKLKRKLQVKKNLESENIENQVQTEVCGSYSKVIYSNSDLVVKNLENPCQISSYWCKIQKQSQNKITNSQNQKQSALQNSLQVSKTKLSYLCFLQLDELKQFFNKPMDTVIIHENITVEQNKLQNQSDFQHKFNSYCGEDYFVKDLIDEVQDKLRTQKGKKSDKKLRFIQNMINNSENYQIQIQNIKPQDSKIKKLNLKRKNRDNGKKTLLIDLDDTLIFTSKPVSYESLTVSERRQHLIKQNDGRVRKLQIRPYAIQFLQKMSDLYQIIIFTAATSLYAIQIRAILDPQCNIISHVLSRQHCFNPNIQSPSKLPLIKDLRLLNRKLSQTILLDNSIYSFWYQIQNGIPITSYDRIDQGDQELIRVAKYLQRVANTRDVRGFNKRMFQLHKYQEYVEALTLVQELYINQY